MTATLSSLALLVRSPAFANASSNVMRPFPTVNVPFCATAPQTVYLKFRNSMFTRGDLM